MTSQRETLSALLAAAGVCWPRPAVPALTRRGEPAAAGRDTVAEFLLVPSAARPRLLVPAGAPAAAAESVRRYSHALPVAERVLRVALTAGLRSGVVDRIASDRLRVEVAHADRGAMESLQDLVAGLLGEPVVLSLGVGTPRANRKPVLQAISRRGRSLAFVKLGDTEVTRDLLRSEAGALSRLREERPAVLTIPRLLYLGPWGDTEVLVQSALPTPPWTRPRRGRPPTDAMRALATAFDRGRGALAATDGWARISTATDRLADGVRRDLYTGLVRELADRYGDRPLRISAWHGDWAPWNMAWVGSTVRLWDWERFAEGVPVGFDPLHYVLNVRARDDGWEKALAGLGADAAPVLAAVGVRPSDAEPITLLYLLDLCRRYLLAAAPRSGTSLRRQADLLLCHLVEAAGGTRPTLPDWSAS